MNSVVKVPCSPDRSTYILTNRIFEIVSNARPGSILCTSRRIEWHLNRRSWKSLRLNARSLLLISSMRLASLQSDALAISLIWTKSPDNPGTNLNTALKRVLCAIKDSQPTARA